MDVMSASSRFHAKVDVKIACMNAVPRIDDKSSIEIYNTIGFVKSMNCSAASMEELVTPSNRIFSPLSSPNPLIYKQSFPVKMNQVLPQGELQNSLNPQLPIYTKTLGQESLADLQDGLLSLLEHDHLHISKTLQKCTSLHQVRHYHHYILSFDLGQATHLSNVLISMYAKYGSLKDSVAVFNKVLNRNVITWTAVITAYARAGRGKEALLLYRRMQEEGISPNNVTYIGLLGACTTKESLVEGKRMHSCMHADHLADVIVGTALVTMYGRCGSVKDARAIFDRLPNGNIISWNAMITVYVDHEEGKEAIGLFRLMQSLGLDANDCTYINSLRACAILEDVVQGRAIHARVVEDGLISDLVVANAILNMYGKCRMPDEAQCVFNTMEEQDLVAWNGLITAYAQHGFGAQGLDVFRHMQQQGVKPDMVTFIGIISACASLAALEEGKWIHASLLAIGLESDVQVGNALIHMYGKCGALDSARSVFDKIRPRNVISWTAIIAAFSQQGHAKLALQLYKEMQEERIKPDEVTYIPLLSACSHAGLVEEGRSCFTAMEKEYHLTPRVEHYVCMIDLFGRAGMLAEAEEFIRKMPHWPDERLWSALLGSCRIHSDAFRGKQAAEQMISLVPKDTSPYVLLSNLYVANSRKNDSERIHAVMDKMVELCKG